MFSLILYENISENCTATKLTVRRTLYIRINKRIVCVLWKETFSLHPFWELLLQHRTPLNVMLNRLDQWSVFFCNYLNYWIFNYCVCINMQRKTVSLLKIKKEFKERKQQQVISQNVVQKSWSSVYVPA